MIEQDSLDSILQDAGFTKGEVKVYLSLLRIGESKVGHIIKNSDISRSKVYDILDRLIRKGVVSKIEKNNVLFYQALSPHTIMNIIKEKERQLKEEETKLQKVIPRLISLLPEQKFNIKVYEGVDGFKAVIERIINELRKGDSFDAMGISKTTEVMNRYALKIYQAQKEKKFKARSVFDESGMYKIKERRNNLHQIKILPMGWHTPALFTMYGDTVGIHLGNDERIISIMINNKDIAESFGTTFELLWKISNKI